MIFSTMSIYGYNITLKMNSLKHMSKVYFLNSRIRANGIEIFLIKWC